MPRFSLIVPVYNVSDELPTCMHSLWKQTNSDFEIIAINDGSTDDSLELLKLYSRVEPRLKIIDKENEGVSKARNAGVDAALGDYIAFIDPDDLVTPNFIEKLVDTFENTGADVITFGAELFPEYAANEWLINSIRTRTAAYSTFNAALMFKEASHPFACRTVCRRSFLNEHDIRFDENLPLGEDQVFHFTIYPLSKKTVLLPDRLYIYRLVRIGSATGSSKQDNEHRYYEHIRVVERICHIWHAMNLTEKYGAELIDWALDFVGIDVLRSPEPERTMLMNYLSGVLNTYFTKQQLVDICQDEKLGVFAKSILVDRDMATGLGRKAIFYKLTFSEEGLIPFINNPLNRVLYNSGIDLDGFFDISNPLKLPREHKAKIEFEEHDAQLKLNALNALNARLEKLQS